MAFISDASSQNRFAAGFDCAVTAVVGFLVAISTAQSRVRQIELLCAKTDEVGRPWLDPSRHRAPRLP